MRPNIVFLFSGQGGQYKGMGKRLYESNTTFATCLEECDAVYRSYLGYSLIEQLYADDQVELDDLLFSSPAILSLEIAMFNTLESMGIYPDYVVGNSIGEFAAAIAAGVWTKEVALEFTIEHAKSIVQSDLPEGGMLNLLNISYEELSPFLLKYKLFIGSINYPNNYTITGEKMALDKMQSELKDRDLLYYRLPIAYYFHCPLINQGKSGFQYFMASPIKLSPPQNGFISGLYCRIMSELTKEYFWNVVSKPMDIPKLVSYMEEKGPCTYIDLGPSGAFANFVKYNLDPSSKSTTHTIMPPFKKELKQLNRLKNYFIQSKPYF